MSDVETTLSLLKNGNPSVVRDLLFQHPYLFHFDIGNGEQIMHRGLSQPAKNSFVDLELTERFLAAGGQVDRTSSFGESLLFLAESHGFPKEVVAYLKLNGATMSQYERAVILLSSVEDTDLVVSCVKSFIDQEREIVNKVGSAGYTLLHHAAQNFQLKAAQLLLERGSNPNALSNSGISPLGLSEETSSGRGAEIAALLLAHGARRTDFEELVTKIHRGMEEEVLDSLKANPRLVHATYWPGWSAIHMAACFGKSCVLVRYLLSHGADPNTLNEAGKTPLHRAVDRVSSLRPSTLQIVELLVESGADLNARDNRGYTPLHDAIGGDWDQPVKLLVELGADVNAKTSNRATAADLVMVGRFLGQRSLLHWLKSKGGLSAKRLKKK